MKKNNFFYLLIYSFVGDQEPQSKKFVAQRFPLAAEKQVRMLFIVAYWSQLSIVYASVFSLVFVKY